jgi:RimJ/RimL family protein N-acetyltransferase/Flp pilus assembly protein TadD
VPFYRKINERIELKLMEHQHGEELWRLLEANRDYVGQWLPWVHTVKSISDVDRLISVWRQQHDANRGFYAGIWFQGRLCGTVGYLLVDWENRWTALTYWLDEAQQGKGIMTAACGALVEHGFESWKLNRIVIECATENKRSRRIPERLGFKLDGVTRECEWLRDHFVDHACYSRLRSEFKGSGPAKLTSGSKDSFETSSKLAFELHNSGRSEVAEALCRELLQIQPEEPQMLFLLGMVSLKAGRNQEAVGWFLRAAKAQPDSARIFNGLGCAYQALKDRHRAMDAWGKAFSLEPGSADTCYNLGNSFYQYGQVDQAETLFRQAVKLNPRDHLSWNNLGKCLKELNRIDESIAAYDQAVALAPDYHVARYGRGFSLLIAGRLPEGFHDYEFRLRSLTPRQFPGVPWNGEPLKGRTILLHAEQGFGDAIQMVRFVAEVRKRAGKVILECRPELRTLFEYSKSADVVVSVGEELPAADVHISLISLPGVLEVTLNTIPGRTPYLAAPASGRLLAAPAGGLKVGIAWAGDPAHHHDGLRSVWLPLLEPILQVPGVVFYSLQNGMPPRNEVYLRSSAIDSSLRFADFLETASVIAELDLVITVDTAVAHLAGALGKPVWTLLQHSPDWRWFLNRIDTPWYPTMRLFRQESRGQWGLPISQVAEALRKLVATASVAL